MLQEKKLVKHTMCWIGLASSDVLVPIYLEAKYDAPISLTWAIMVALHWKRQHAMNTLNEQKCWNAPTSPDVLVYKGFSSFE